MTLEDQILSSLKSARAAARSLALASTEQKNDALLSLARMLRADARAILEANRKDLERASAASIRGAFLDRLALNDARIEAIAAGVDQVAALPDPVGETIEEWRRPNGLE